MKHRLPRTQASDASELSRRVYDLERKMDSTDTGVETVPMQARGAWSRRIRKVWTPSGSYEVVSLSGNTEEIYLDTPMLTTGAELTATVAGIYQASFTLTFGNPGTSPPEFRVEVSMAPNVGLENVTDYGTYIPNGIWDAVAITGAGLISLAVGGTIELAVLPIAITGADWIIEGQVDVSYYAPAT